MMESVTVNKRIPVPILILVHYCNTRYVGINVKSAVANRVVVIRSDVEILSDRQEPITNAPRHKVIRCAADIVKDAHCLRLSTS